MGSDKEDQYINEPLANPELHKYRESETIISQIDTDDKYYSIVNAINNTEIKEIEDKEDEISPEIISKLEKIVSKAPKLELLIKDSLYLEIGLKIKINALGLVEKSLRGKKDGYTYFGILSPEDSNNDIKIDFSTIDYINNINNIKDNQVQYGRQFCIRFNLNDNGYYIKDCCHGNGYGSFMKIIKEMKIKDNTLINIGENYVVFTLGVDDLDHDNNYVVNDKILSVKVFRGELNNYSYAFNKKQINKILIGKNDNCDIVINDNLLDDIHCIIEYKKGQGWVIQDGSDKKSENGTWLSLSEETKIFEGMIIQSNQNIYQCHIIN